MSDATAGPPLGARLEEIERLARAATPGPWKRLTPEENLDAHANIDTTVVCESGANVLRHRVLCEMNRHFPLADADAEFIAACSPDFILSLLAALRSASPDDLAAAYANGMIEGHHRARHTDGSLPGSFVVEAAAKYITAESGAAARRGVGEAMCECGHSAAHHADEGPGFTCVGWISDAFTNGPPSDAGHFCPCEEFRPAPGVEAGDR